MHLITGAASLGFLLSLLLVAPAGAQQQLLPGDSFPEVQLPLPADKAAVKYLGLSPGIKSFTPGQVEADLLLVELLNVHCPHCQMQVPAYNELFKLIETDQDNRLRIKILGIAVGNTEQEVETFRLQYQIPYPILTDPSFKIWRALGSGTTPSALYVRLGHPGRAGILVGTHKGLNTDYKKLFPQLLRWARRDSDELRQLSQEVREKRQLLRPAEPVEILEYKVRTEFTRLGHIEDFSKLELFSGRQVYTAMVRKENSRQRLFAEIASHGSVCDVCHDTHFIYLFDRSTRVIAFEPIQLTKYGNLQWDETEVERMRRKVMGRHLSQTRSFSPELDAITSATMTSALIFDSLDQGEELLIELRELGFF